MVRRFAHEWRLELKTRVGKLKQSGIIPGLAIILIGDNPASRSYVRLKTEGMFRISVSIPNSISMGLPVKNN